MNINTSAAGMRDSLIEAVGIKAGLALSSDDLIRVIDREMERTDDSTWWYSPRPWLHAPLNTWVRLRAEDFEALAVRLMYAVGALPDPRNQTEVLVDFAKRNPDYVARLKPQPDENELPLPVTPLMRFLWHAKELLSLPDVPPELREFAETWDRRSLLDFITRRPTARWDGVASLSELFGLNDLGGETSASKDSPPLIDQKFIDYLHAQPQDLTRMHWRQFEYLVGEFFRRNGYEVVVTPPSGDGGVDVRAVRTATTVGPELVIVQAKRLADDRKVDIETVKALWTDVNDNSATRGLIATTTVLAKGAREFCEARQYRLTAAERDTVNLWLQQLATHPRG